MSVTVSTAESLRLKQLDHTAWTSKDGAPIAIFAMAQAPDGKLWLGSQSGLYQFDGVHFNNFRPAAGEPELPIIVVSAICISTDGTVWVGGLQGGIVAIREGHLTVYGPKDGLPTSGGISQGGISQGPDGTIWVVVRDHLLQLRQGRWQEARWNGGPALNNVDQVFFDRSGTQWVAGGGQIYSRQRASDPFVLRTSGSTYGNSLIGARDGSIWVIEAQHLGTPPITVKLVAEAGNPAAHGTDSIGDQSSVFDDNGNLWFANDHGLLRFAPNQWPKVPADPAAIPEVYAHIDGLSSDSVTSLLRDNAGSIWVATSRGLDRFKTPALVRYMDVPLTGEVSLASCPNGDVWIASRDSPLVSIHDGATIPHGYPRWITSLHCDAHGVLWFGEQNGIWRYENDQFTYIPFPPDLPRLAVRQMSGDANRLFLAVRRGGLWTFSNGGWTKFTGPGVPDEPAYSVLEESADRLWAGYAGSRIGLVDHGRGRTFNIGTGTGLGMIQTLKQTHRGLLVGGTNGLAIFRGDGFQVLRVADLGAAQGVSGFAETANGDLWINGSHGIFRIRSGEVEAALRSPLYAMQSESVLLDGGPVGPAGQGGYASTLVAGPNGKLWFANTDQVVSFDPGAQPPQPAPSAVEITSAIADGAALNPQSPLAISAVHTLRVGYLAVDMTSPERLRYRYRLDGEDKDWQEAGTRTEAAYTNLHPGTYTFHAAASNDGLVWRESAQQLTIRVLPAFYESIWFRTLCGVLLCVLVWLAISIRIAGVSARIRERSEERANERVQIARDLHDTLLQGIQGLMLRFHFAAQKVPEGGEVREMLDTALNSADRILQEGRERVTHLRTSTSIIHADLLNSLEIVGKGLSWTDDVAFVIVAEGTPRELRPHVNEELFCIGREALTNAFRHAKASRIELNIDYGRTELRLQCRDDGCGMEQKMLDEGRSGHWGLLGIRERANSIDATLVCKSVLGSGTEILVTLPARRAYAPDQSWQRLRAFMQRITRRIPKP